MADRFYVNSPLALGQVVIQGPEAHHIATVMRVKTGEAVVLFNGDGAEYHAIVADASKKAVDVDVRERLTPAREVGFRLIVAASMPKGDRADFLIEKLTELGVTDFVPLRTARSVVHPRESKLDRLQRAVIESSKQCGRNVLMSVHELSDWSNWCRSELPEDRRMAHVGAEAGGQAQGDTVIAVGPEGGWSDEEVALAATAGWQIHGLGPRILRVETAAIVMVARRLA